MILYSPPFVQSKYFISSLNFPFISALPLLCFETGSKVLKAYCFYSALQYYVEHGLLEAKVPLSLSPQVDNLLGVRLTASSLAIMY